MNKIDEVLELLKQRECENEKPKNVILWVLAIVGAVAAVAGIAYAVYRFVTPDYLEDFEDDFEDEGLESFKSFIFNDKLMNELCIYGAFEENKLIGIMGTKNEGKHISLFFIKKEFHRKGIGKQLFDYSQCDCPANEITVNSSTYAIRFYESLGFEKTNDRQQTNGISYTPMKLISNK